MTFRLMTTACIAMLCTTPALAQQFNGGSISAQYKQFTNDDDDQEIFSLLGSAELGLGGAFALGGNFSSFDSGGFDDNEVLNATLHAMYMTSPNSAVGLFAAQDIADFSDSTNYGVEIGARSERSRFEAYYGFAELDDAPDVDFTIAGVLFEFGIGNGFSLGLQYESYTAEDGIIFNGANEDLTFGDTAIFAQYQFNDGPSLYAELGQISTRFSSGDENFTTGGDLEYIGIGASYAIGRNGGTVFGDRTLVGFGG